MKLAVDKGCFAYNADTVLLKEISFEAGAGDLMAVLGPNGAGKTTLLRCMMGFLKWQSGRSLLDGRDIRSIAHRELWRRIAYVPQAKNVTAAYTAREMVLLGRSSHLSLFAKPRQEDIEKTDAVMEQLHITKLRDKKCSEISGGELQMVLIARALAAEPMILILDEPESNLDFRNQLIVLETMSRLAAGGMTCIFNTHFPEHALQRANKSLIVSRGGDFIFGNTREVVTEDNIRSAFGVQTMIGEVETEDHILRHVIPLAVAAEGRSMQIRNQTSQRIAVVAIITDRFEAAETINGILHEYSEYIVGHMGMPYARGGVHIMNVTLDAPASIVYELADTLGILPGVSVKTTFARETD